MNERDEPMLQQMIRQLERAATNTDTDPRWRAAAESRKLCPELSWAESPAEVEASRQRSAVGAEAADMSRETRMAVMLAYGHLWHVNNEPMAPVPMYSPEKAAYEARKQLRDLLTGEERGEAINQVGVLIGSYERLSPPPSERPAAPAQAGVTDTLRELLEAVEAPFPPAEEGKDAQTKWAERRGDARAAAYCLLAGTPPAQSNTARPFGCLLAMRVLQSDLYKQLDDDERAQCDELVQRNLEWFKRDSVGNAGVHTPDGSQ